jgi:hypothetical protein
MRRTEEILYRLVIQYYKEYPNESIYKTKLFNLLYLLDRRVSMQDNNQRLTNVDYLNYRNGPRSEEISEAVQKAKERHLFHEVEDKYEPCNCTEHDTKVRFNSFDDIVASVVEEYGAMNKKELIRFIKTLPEIEEREKYAPIEFRGVADNNN